MATTDVHVIVVHVMFIGHNLIWLLVLVIDIHRCPIKNMGRRTLIWQSLTNSYSLVQLSQVITATRTKVDIIREQGRQLRA